MVKSPKAVIAWSFWDWGSAAFNAVLVTFVFSVYLTDSVGATLPAEFQPSVLYSLAVAIGGVIIALTAPAMGRSADVHGTRRRSLRLWTVVTTVLMLALFAVKNTDPIYFWIGITIMAVANITFEFAEVQYYAQLGQISNRDNVGKISGFGWSMGYLGGIVLLIICYFGFVSGDGGLLHLPTAEGLNIRLVAMFAAVWFLVSAIPCLVVVPEIKPQPTGKELPTGIVATYKDLFHRILQLFRTDKNAVMFLVAAAVYRDGLAAVFTFGAILAATVYGLSAGDVLLFGIAANVVAALGSVLAGLLDDKIGPKPVIMFSLAVMFIDSTILYFVDGPQNFWIFGLILCAFVGPAQSSSRSLLTRMSSRGQEGELFGLYTTTGRAVSWIAPTLYGLFVRIIGQDKAGILAIILVLLIGAILLIFVKTPRFQATESAQDNLTEQSLSS